MPNNVTPKSQSRLAALLRYHQHGDFATFARALDSVFERDDAPDSFHYPNMLFAYQLSGFCEISSVSGAIEWWCAHVGTIQIKSALPKEIGTSAEWFLKPSGTVIPLITDLAGRTLVLGSRIDNELISDHDSLFWRPMCDALPSFLDAEAELCSEVPYRTQLENEIEIEFFQEETARWQIARLDALQGSYLIRCRREYAGYDYYVLHTSLRLRFKIAQPEWAFVVAYHLTAWKMNTLFKIHGTSIQVPRTVRLPTAIYRFLFACASHAVVGPAVIFHDVSKNCVDGLIRYFSSAGDRT
jgi:hypothetical protein